MQFVSRPKLTSKYTLYPGVTNSSPRPNIHIDDVERLLKRIIRHGEVNFKVEINGLTVHCSTYLTDLEIDGVNLYNGQPVINGEDVSLIVHNS